MGICPALHGFRLAIVYLGNLPESSTISCFSEARREVESEEAVGGFGEDRWVGTEEEERRNCEAIPRVLTGRDGLRGRKGGRKVGKLWESLRGRT